MANSFTSQLRFPLLTSGNINTWGTLLNNGAKIGEQAVTGILGLDVTNGDQFLSSLNGVPDQARYAAIRATGNPGAARTVVVPTISKIFLAINDTSPGFPVTFATAIGGVAIAAGTSAFVYVDITSGVVKVVDAPSNKPQVVNSQTLFLAGLIPSVPASGYMSLKIMRVGNVIAGTAKITAQPTLNTGTTIFDTSPYITAALSPVVDSDFPVAINEAGTVRDSFLRIPTGGADWYFSRLNGAVYGAATSRAFYGGSSMAFEYSLV